MKKAKNRLRPLLKVAVFFIGTSGVSINLLKGNKLRAERRTETAGFYINIDAYRAKNVAKKSPDSQGCFYCKTGQLQVK